MSTPADDLKEVIKACQDYVKERIRMAWRDYMSAVLSSGANVDDAAHVADMALAEEMNRFGAPRSQS